MYFHGCIFNICIQSQWSQNAWNTDVMSHLTILSIFDPSGLVVNLASPTRRGAQSFLHLLLCHKLLMLPGEIASSSFSTLKKWNLSYGSDSIVHFNTYFKASDELQWAQEVCGQSEWHRRICKYSVEWGFKLHWGKHAVRLKKRAQLFLFFYFQQYLSVFFLK